MITANDLIPLSRERRKEIILESSSLIDASHIDDGELRVAFQIARVLEPLIKPYVDYKVEQDRQSGSVLKLSHQSRRIQDETKKFAKNFIEWLEERFEVQQTINENVPVPSNLYELCQTKLLAISNAVTRTLSTRTGHLCERLASISPLVVNPEKEFGVSITGVDIIICTEIVEFAQLKTKRDTLTGSQLGRTRRELSLHHNSLFIAAFDIADWHSPKGIPRIAGLEFWSKIGISYELIEKHMTEAMQDIDEAYIALAANEA